METFVLLLIMAAISLFNWLMKRSAEAREAREQAERENQDQESVPKVSHPSRQATPPLAKKSEEERLREFMEALGIPKDKLPRSLRREERPPMTYQPEPKPAQATPPPLGRESPKPPKKREPSPAITQPDTAEPSVEPAGVQFSKIQEISETIAHDAYQIKTASERAASVPAVELGVVLKSRNGFRNAVLMREILGPPRSLQPYSDPPKLA